MIINYIAKIWQEKKEKNLVQHTYICTIAGGDCPKFETFFSVQNLALISIFAVLLQKVQGLFYSWSSFKSLEIFGMKISLKSDIGVASNLRECEGSAEILKKVFKKYWTHIFWLLFMNMGR